MQDTALAPLERAIAALTYDEIERIDVDSAGRQTVTTGDAIPLLDRSIAQDLVRIERAIGSKPSLLGATAAAIDEALLAIEEARLAITGGAA